MEKKFISKRPLLLPNQEIGVISTFFTEQMLMRDFSIIRLKPESYVEIILEKQIEVVFIDSNIYENDNMWFDYEIEEIIKLMETVDVNIVIVNNESNDKYISGNYYYINLDIDRKEIDIDGNILNMPVILNENIYNPINDKPKLDVLYFSLGKLIRGEHIQNLHVKEKPVREEIVAEKLTRQVTKELIRKIKNAKVLYIYYSDEIPPTFLKYIEVVAALQNTMVILDSNYDAESNISLNTKDEKSNIELVSAFYRNGIYREKNVIKKHRTAFLEHTLITYKNLNKILQGDVSKEEVGISVITSTKRKWTLDDYVIRLNKQANVKLQVVLLTHGFSLTESEKEKLASKAEFNLTIINEPSTLSFGLCLNKAISFASEKYFTKLDDDDYYYSNYLIDSWIAHKYSSANIVGKHSQFVYLEDSKMIIQRFNSQQYKYSEYVAGATIFCETEFINKYLFSDLKKAVDSDLLRRVREDGGKLYCLHPYEFCIFRAGDKSEHTWQVDDIRLLKSAKIHFIGDPTETIEVN